MRKETVFILGYFHKGFHFMEVNGKNGWKIGNCKIPMDNFVD